MSDYYPAKMHLIEKQDLYNNKSYPAFGIKPTFIQVSAHFDLSNFPHN
jgi:hypothetical protein